MSEIRRFPTRGVPEAEGGTYDAYLKKNPGAVGGEASTETRDLTEAPGAPASMRRILDLMCLGCTYAWTAPAVGRCPRCQSDQVKAESERTCLLKRV